MIITIPTILTAKLGDDGAEALANLLNKTTSDTRQDLATKGDLTTGLAETKSELLKWMVIMWITQISAIGLLFFK